MFQSCRLGRLKSYNRCVTDGLIRISQQGDVTEQALGWLENYSVPCGKHPSPISVYVRSFLSQLGECNVIFTADMLRSNETEIVEALSHFMASITGLVNDWIRFKPKVSKNWHLQLSCLTFSIKKDSVKPSPCVVSRSTGGSLNGKTARLFRCLLVKTTLWVKSLQYCHSLPRKGGEDFYHECIPRALACPSTKNS